MAAKPKFSAAPKPPTLTAEQAAFVDTGRGKDRAPASEQTTSASSVRAEAVAGAAEQVPPLQRMSIDLPKRLHSQFKAACALAETKMAAEIIAFIERRTAELEGRNE